MRSPLSLPPKHTLITFFLSPFSLFIFHVSGLIAFPALAQPISPEVSTRTDPAKPILQIQGVLEVGDTVLSEDSSLYDEYTFEGQAGQTVIITLESVEFNTYLLLLDSKRQGIEQNDDYDESTLNSAIVITLPETGTYAVLVNGYDAQSRGNYSLTIVSAASAASQPQFSETALQQAEANRLNQEGLQQLNTSQFQTALQSFGQALTIYQEIGDRAGEGAMLNNIGLVYDGTGEYAQALDYYEQALVILRAVGDRAGEGRTLNNIGEVYNGTGEYAQALDYYEQALVILRAVGDRAGEGTTLNNIGAVYNSTGEYAQALDYYEQALVIRRAVGDRAGEGTTLNNIGAVYNSTGEYAQALDYYEQALVILRAVGDRAGEGTTLSNIGAVYRNTGEYAQALSYYEQALVILRAVGNRAGEGATLNNIGLVYWRTGEYAQALDYYEQALVIRREIGDRAGEGTTLSNIGAVYDSTGEYAQALDYYQQALVISREIGNRVVEGTTLSNIGAVYRNTSEYAQALGYYEQALVISREIDNRAGEGNTLSNIGAVYDSTGEYAQALDYYQQALVISREIGNRAGEGVTLTGIGAVYDSTGEYAQALDYYQQALVISREIGDRAGEGNTLTGIGKVYWRTGEYAQALNYYEQALVISRAVGNRAAEGIMLNNIGAVYDSTGEYAQALDYYQQALVISRAVGDREGEGNTLNNIAFAYDNSEQFVTATNYFLAAIETFESLRTVDLSDTSKISFFDTYLDSYLGLQRSLVAQGETNQALEYAERGRARAFVDLLVSQVTSNGEANAPLLGSTNTLNLADIQRVAREQNATLVQYSAISDRLLYIWVIQPTGEIAFQQVDLATLDRSIRELVTTSRDAIGVRGRDSGTVVPVLSSEAQQEREAQQRQNLQRLYQLLIEPIAQHLPTDPEQRVIFIPHQDLFLVPFAALTNAEGQYLIENHTILTAPSVQVLDLTRRQQLTNSDFSAQNENLLIIGNPIMPEVWNPQTNQMEQLSSLVGAENEAVAIAETFGTEALLWDGAAKATVVEQMPNAQIIHFATHGLLEYGNPQESGVLDIPGAIALAPSANDSGLLTSAEILQMELTAELVVLSACDTGRGRVTGDGVVGLSRAFVTAGVPSIVVSLWAVDDAATAELMVEFYDQWQQTGDKAQALRQAMLTTMQNHPNPRLWAAFTLIGEAE